MVEILNAADAKGPGDNRNYYFGWFLLVRRDKFSFLDLYQLLFLLFSQKNLYCYQNKDFYGKQN